MAAAGKGRGTIRFCCKTLSVGSLAWLDCGPFFTVPRCPPGKHLLFLLPWCDAAVRNNLKQRLYLGRVYGFLQNGIYIFIFSNTFLFIYLSFPKI